MLKSILNENAIIQFDLKMVSIASVGLEPLISAIYRCIDRGELLNRFATKG